ncbi:hypothetical protein DFH11DRAFT_1506471 [Phellopilus nigrolimitatus]|nr:hypothetical protein DFH11DRAFT_1519251 [Phellopilus nigrolimitatus]KAH8111761.1 hypothetical protein DFH11DRAFT_1512541 [Phellopilus nigrolimitatus]KAH8113040.1 hypothetical protein DFH11DRAFT_1510779 [Phellopilus nigrolimitatus]KAH8116612.1 hypothetical protein DFH11DRAFT_1506471 [Phellopilus nigrolimitatus]
MNTKYGTTNLLNGACKCDSERGFDSLRDTHTLQVVAPRYSHAAHRALMALRSASDNRPFHALADKHYLMEVEMLRPGTIVPSPSTTSRDINDLYLELSKNVRNYFQVCSSSILFVY